MIATVILRGPRWIDPRYAGADDPRAQETLGDYDSDWSSAADGRENRRWCEAIHRGRWPS